MVLSDTLREQSDASATAHQLGIGEVHAGCLPEDKRKWIADRQARGQAVCMISMGIGTFGPEDMWIQ